LQQQQRQQLHFDLHAPQQITVHCHFYSNVNDHHSTTLQFTFNSTSGGWRELATQKEGEL